MKRAIQTVKDVKAPQERWKALNEIDAVRQYFVGLLRPVPARVAELFEKATAALERKGVRSSIT